MKSLRLIISSVTVICLGLATVNVKADDDDLLEMQMLSKEFGLITLEQAKAKALAAKPGVVTDAEIERRKFSKGWDYEFEIVDADGREWDIDVDAKTGKVTKIRRDWF